MMLLSNSAITLSWKMILRLFSMTVLRIVLIRCWIRLNHGDHVVAIKKASGCIHPLASRVLPHIGPILSYPQQQPNGLVAGSMDLVTILVKNAPIDVLKAAYQVLFDPVVRIALQSNDHSEIVRVALERIIFLKNAEAVVQRQIIWSDLTQDMKTEFLML
ncbi:hypothetical protein OROMI_004991 [Orobanche minor]